MTNNYCEDATMTTTPIDKSPSSQNQNSELPNTNCGTSLNLSNVGRKKLSEIEEHLESICGSIDEVKRIVAVDSNATNSLSSARRSVLEKVFDLKTEIMKVFFDKVEDSSPNNAFKLQSFMDNIDNNSNNSNNNSEDKDKDKDKDNNISSSGDIKNVVFAGNNTKNTVNQSNASKPHSSMSFVANNTGSINKNTIANTNVKNGNSNSNTIKNTKKSVGFAAKDTKNNHRITVTSKNTNIIKNAKNIASINNSSSNSNNNITINNNNKTQLIKNQQKKLKSSSNFLGSPLFRSPPMKVPAYGTLNGSSNYDSTNCNSGSGIDIKNVELMKKWMGNDEMMKNSIGVVNSSNSNINNNSNIIAKINNNNNNNNNNRLPSSKNQQRHNDGDEMKLGVFATNNNSVNNNFSYHSSSTSNMINNSSKSKSNGITSKNNVFTKVTSKNADTPKPPNFNLISKRKMMSSVPFRGFNMDSTAMSSKAALISQAKSRGSLSVSSNSNGLSSTATISPVHVSKDSNLRMNHHGNKIEMATKSINNSKMYLQQQQQQHQNLQGLELQQLEIHQQQKQSKKEIQQVERPVVVAVNKPSQPFNSSSFITNSKNNKKRKYAENGASLRSDLVQNGSVSFNMSMEQQNQLQNQLRKQKLQQTQKSQPSNQSQNQSQKQRGGPIRKLKPTIRRRTSRRSISCNDVDTVKMQGLIDDIFKSL
eukprot:TRINITY_DN1212_c0_g1_i1.p1 TRINITY_DN1212_c0_g1~~TRINITY_DN1212_c0_g1_i1.p1  ORF type:complete len:704 (+),score=206.82 TRINITY_DN1212_c0_g1_i1:3-2114(+)